MTARTVMWLNLNPLADARGSWDQGIVEELTRGPDWNRLLLDYNHEPRDPFGNAGIVASDIMPKPGSRYTVDGGMVFVVAGQHNADPNLAEAIGKFIGSCKWALTIVTSDEQALFPLEALPRGPHHEVWTQYHPSPHASRVIPIGMPPDTARFVLQRQGATAPVDERRLLVSFAGQTNAGTTPHPRRLELVRAMNDLRGWSLDVTDSDTIYVKETDGFTQGLERVNYLTILTMTRLAPCPSGYHSLDSFRLYEALQAGALPIIETNTPQRPEGELWDQMFANHPIPTVDSWDQLAELAVKHADRDIWQQERDAVWAWWVAWRDQLDHDFRATVERLSG